MYCERCNEGTIAPIHHAECSKKVVIERFPPNGIALVIEILQSMDMDLTVDDIDHLMHDAAKVYLDAEGTTGLNCAAEKAYLNWSKLGW